MAASRVDPAVAAEIDRLATALAKDPRSKLFLPLADEYIKADMWQEAAMVLEDGITVYPGFVTAMAALGRVYDQLGQTAKAKTILEAVVAQRPDNLRAHRILAKLYRAEGLTEQAVRSCDAILNANAFDEEATALKRGLVAPSTQPSHAPPAESAIEATRAMPEPTIASAESDVASNQDACIQSVADVHETTLDVEPELEPVGVAPASRHAATIVKLESWLHRIQSTRRADARPR